MDKIKQVFDLRTRGWSYRKIGKKLKMNPRRVLIVWWKSHLTKKELKAYNDQVNFLSREKYRILREAAVKKGLSVPRKSTKE